MANKRIMNQYTPKQQDVLDYIDRKGFIDVDNQPVGSYEDVKRRCQELGTKGQLIRGNGQVWKKKKEQMTKEQFESHWNKPIQ